jgi:cytoskeleton protein RodZ
MQSAAATALPVTVVGSGTTSGLVVFKARGASWVEVVDASGVVQLRKTMADGDVIGASGAVPLSVVVGRADTTVVEVRGKPFDLTRVARDNVARFEVK